MALLLAALFLAGCAGPLIAVTVAGATVAVDASDHFNIEGNRALAP